MYIVHEIDRPGQPLQDEYYGPLWWIVAEGDEFHPIVIVPDKGDGSALPLAQKIVQFLNNLESNP